jgi:RecA/RadA recombinase
MLASTLLQTSPPSSKSLPTHCNTIDRALQGGFPYGAITSISGGATGGVRALLAIHAFCTHLRSGGEAVWVDTTGCFPAEMLREVLSGSEEEEEEEEEDPGVMERGRVVRAFDLVGVGEAVDMREMGEGVLVVVDTVSLPYRAAVGRGLLLGQSQVVDLLRTLQAVCREKGAAVLLLNDVPDPTYSADPAATTTTGTGAKSQGLNEIVGKYGTLRLLSGPTFAYGVDMHVLLCEREKGKVVMEVLTDRVGGREGGAAEFMVEGVELKET